VLSELYISNLAIIDSLQLTFAPGFNALTGETGAGKSIIIDAVSTLLGGRADADLVRTGAEAARVEGVFVLAPEARAGIAGLLQEHGLDEDTGSLILTREIKRNGRHLCRVNGRAVTLSVFTQVGEHLVDIHGQSEHLSLLRVKEHLEFLDRYGNLLEQRASVAGLVRTLRQVREELASLRRDERELARRSDMLQYQVREIEDAGLKSGEEEQLTTERRLLVNAERLSTLANDVFQKLSGGGEEQGSVVDLLQGVLEDLGELARLDPQAAAHQKLVEEASYQLDDLAHTLRDYRETIEANPQRLLALDDRLDLIHNLKRKYGSTVADVLRYGEEKAQELYAITHNEERIAGLEKEEARLLVEAGASAAALSAARRAAGEGLASAVEAELHDLSMAKARFAVDVSWKPDPSGLVVDGTTYAFDTSGIDHVEFLISPNVGEPPKPLIKIASGGETSRLMLALKTVLANADRVPTLIFDEIDQGIGGRAGGVVGLKLWGLTSAHQVLCVTHLPQLACFGDVHLKVEKVENEGRTVTRVTELDEGARVDELSAMLGGPAGAARLQSAREMLDESVSVKRARPKAQPAAIQKRKR
jgi:DNA repair protein RecN (Recombination protein N)